MVVHSKAGNTFSCPAGRQQPSSVPVLARGGRHAGRGSGLGLVDIVRDGGRWSSRIHFRTGGPRTQAPACCHAHRDPAGCASSIRSSCPASVAAGAGHPPPALPRPGAGALGAGPSRRPGSAGDHRPATADAGALAPEASRCLPVLWPTRVDGKPVGSTTGTRPGSWPEGPDHHTQPGLAPGHYRTAPSEISGRPIQDLRPSDPAGLLTRRRGTRPCGPELRPSCTGLSPARRLPRSLPPGRGRPRTRPCCVLTPDRRGWHSSVAVVPALAKTFLPGGIR